LQYFSPAIPGDVHFYSELTSSCSNYYNDEKWEFDFVRKYIKSEQKVLDIACGKGAFLSSIVGLLQARRGIHPQRTGRGVFR
jgi:2-polyprenyl-3-methyl-5-hydroxy-6-metoxy-1,4-benzoquinol methylase